MNSDFPVLNYLEDDNKNNNNNNSNNNNNNNKGTGTISKSLREYLSNIAGKYEIKVLYCHIGHYTHTAESSSVKYKTFFMVEITQTVNTKQL